MCRMSSKTVNICGIYSSLGEAFEFCWSSLANEHNTLPKSTRRHVKLDKFVFGTPWLPDLLCKHWFASSVWNFCRWVADVPPRETSPAAKRELGICQPRGHLPAFDTHVVSFSKITKHRGFYSKHKHIGLSIKDGKKLYRFLKACFLDFMHAFFHYLGHPPFLVLNAFPDFAHSNAYRLDCVINENCCSVDWGSGICPILLSPLQGICSSRVPAPRKLTPKEKKC